MFSHTATFHLGDVSQAVPPSNYEWFASIDYHFNIDSDFDCFTRQGIFARKKKCAAYSAIAITFVGTCFGYTFFMKPVDVLFGDTVIDNTSSTLLVMVVYLLLWILLTVFGFMTGHWSSVLSTYEKTMPLCLKCGYNLKGTVEAQGVNCPECGVEIPLG